MDTIEVIFAPIIGWIYANPISSTILGVLIGGGTIYAKTIIQTVAKMHGKMGGKYVQDLDNLFNERTSPRRLS